MLAALAYSQDAAARVGWLRDRDQREGRASDLVGAACGGSVDQVDCLVRADIDIGHVRRLTVGVFPVQIHVTILAPRYFSPRPLAGFQRA